MLRFAGVSGSDASLRRISVGLMRVCAGGRARVKLRCMDGRSLFLGRWVCVRGVNLCFAKFRRVRVNGGRLGLRRRGDKPSCATGMGHHSTSEEGGWVRDLCRLSFLRLGVGAISLGLHGRGDDPFEPSCATDWAIILPGRWVNPDGCRGLRRVQGPRPLTLVHVPSCQIWPAPWPARARGRSI